MCESCQGIKEYLMQLDREFDAYTAEKGVEGWVSYFAEDGAMVPSEGEIIKGKEAIYNLMKGSFARKEFSLRWAPEDGLVSEDGTLGYTYGKYRRRYVDESGQEMIGVGRYTSIWKKQADGSWKIVLDMGN